MMGDIKIGQPLPVDELTQVSPFILLHHGEPKVYEPGEAAMEVAPHPHRGFEPVTFVFYFNKRSMTSALQLWQVSGYWHLISQK